MDTAPVGKRTLIFTITFSICIVAAIFITSLSHKTAITICDVGQGDASHIRINNSFDIVIDGGPNKSVLSCLGKSIPLYDRTIELIIITHPHADHYVGLIDVVDRYTIGKVIMVPLTNESESFATLVEKLQKNNIPIIFATEVKKLTILGRSLTFYWPTTSYLSSHSSSSPNSQFFSSTKNPNDFSIVTVFEEDGFRALFSGDASPAVLNSLLQQSGLKSDILKVPHHGSSNGLTSQFLELADPTLSVITVGKTNRFGHPSKEILSLLEASNRQYLRTDRDGSVKITLLENNRFTAHASNSRQKQLYAVTQKHSKVAYK